MKKIFLFLLLILFPSIYFSCSKTPTAQEMFKEENKAIERFIKSNGFNVLDDYPKDGVFGEKDFFKTPDGLYIQVIDTGNGIKPAVNQEVLVRYDSVFYLLTSDKYGFPTGAGSGPASFLYKNSYTYGQRYMTACAGWVIPLDYVGEKGRINVIVPSLYGTYDNQANYRPVYFTNLFYTRIIKN